MHGPRARLPRLIKLGKIQEIRGEELGKEVQGRIRRKIQGIRGEAVGKELGMRWRGTWVRRPCKRSGRRWTGGRWGSEL